VIDIVTASDAIDADLAAQTGLKPTPGPAIAMEDVAVADGSGRPLMSCANLTVNPGESVHISGESSTGKSVLVRVLAGLWPRSRGTLTLPEGARVMIAPQKTYLPLGSLKGSLLYPEPDMEVSDTELIAALERVGLGQLKGRLSEVARWDQVLSNGERQRLAVARLLVHKPDIVVLDDALSAMEESAQVTLLGRLRTDLPRATVIALGQRLGAAVHHDRHYVLERDGEAACLVPLGPALARAT
jgi:putative ATP-binding cassette transporter